MAVKFLDLQEASNPLNGLKIQTVQQLTDILDSVRIRDAFIFELVGDAGLKATVGVGGNIGFVQYGRSDGEPPYSIATTTSESAPQEARHQREQAMEFLCGGTATPVPSRYCLPYEVVKEILVSFLEGGGRSTVVSWEEI